MEIVIFVSGLLLGSIIVFFIYQQKNKNENVLSRQQFSDLRSEVENCKTELAYKNELIIELNRELASKRSDFNNLQEKLQIQKKEMEELHQRFSVEFKNLANEILEEKSQKFTLQNKTNLSEILNPLKEKIQSFEKKVEETNKESIERNTALKQQILSLKELNQQITREAENLTRALKGDTKTQGNWGEFILEKILEKSGLTKGREYKIQESFTTEDGNRLQPDVIVDLPDNRHIIIDSKVSLVAYEKFVNATDNEEKERFLKEHQNSVRTHIKNLSDKNYQDIYGLAGLDFILLFMPVEPAFSMAIQIDEDIFMHAYSKNIVIVSPSTLIATLRTIANIWKQEYQSRNALEIARQGGELYDKFVGLLEDLKDVGNKLDQTQRGFDSAINKLSTGKGNLIKRAEDIKQLGIKTKKSIPADFTEQSDNTD